MYSQVTVMVRSLVKAVPFNVVAVHRYIPAFEVDNLPRLRTEVLLTTFTVPLPILVHIKLHGGLQLAVHVTGSMLVLTVLSKYDDLEINSTFSALTEKKEKLI